MWAWFIQAASGIWLTTPPEVLFWSGDPARTIDQVVGLVVGVAVVAI